MTSMPVSQPRHGRRPTAPTGGHGATAANSPSPFASAVLLLLLLFVSLICSAEAQSPSNSPGPYGNLSGRFNPSMAIIIVVLISAFFFMGFFSIYIRQCNERADPSLLAGGPGGGVARSRRAAARGLDPAVIQTLPMLVYADVKEHKIGKGALECAVCLSEFDDEDTLRLLPKCDHVFHPECIDAWLSAHTTCPVCRANLAPDANANANAPAPTAASRVAFASATAAPAAAEANQVVLTTAAVDDAELRSEGGDGTAPVAAGQPDRVAITIENPPSPKAPASPPATGRTARMESKSRLPWRSKSFVRPPRFPRSQSTGHSMAMVQPGDDCERYTLRLPDNVRSDIMAGKLRRSSSCVAIHVGGEGSTRKGDGGGGGEGGEGSSGGGGSVGGRSFKLRRWEWVAKSDRWAFFTRTFSMRTPRGEGSTRRGEGSTSRAAEGGGDTAGEGSVKAKAFPAVRSPFDCLGGVSGDGAADEEAPTKPTVPAARV